MRLEMKCFQSHNLWRQQWLRCLSCGFFLLVSITELEIKTGFTNIAQLLLKWKARLRYSFKMNVPTLCSGNRSSTRLPEFREVTFSCDWKVSWSNHNPVLHTLRTSWDRSTNTGFFVYMRVWSITHTVISLIIGRFQLTLHEIRLSWSHFDMMYQKRHF